MQVHRCSGQDNLRGRALSSLTAEDAIAYRRFLRHPTPRARWVGAAQPRSSPLWRPFAGDLSVRSVAFALSILNAVDRFRIEQRYVLANPFAGVKVRGGRPVQLDTAVVGKGHKVGKVVLPPLARVWLDRYLVQRGLPVTPNACWATPGTIFVLVPLIVDQPRAMKSRPQLKLK